MGWVANLGFVDSPSVITGDRVATNFEMVSRTASLPIDSNSSRDKLPRSYCSKAVMTFCGRGTLPIGSVGMVISKRRRDSAPRQTLPAEFPSRNIRRLHGLHRFLHGVDRAGEQRKPFSGERWLKFLEFRP